MSFQRGHKGFRDKESYLRASEKVSKSLKGKKLSDEHRKKLSLIKLNNPVRYWKGKKFSLDYRKKLSEARKDFYINGGIHPKGNWRGGRTPVNLLIRASLKYQLWRASVFERDKYTCIWCGLKSGNG